MSTSPTTHRALALGEQEKAALRESWKFYEPRSAEIFECTRRAAAGHPAWRSFVEGFTQQQNRDGRQAILALQRAAIFEDRWDPYLAYLRAKGTDCARAGVAYSAWFDLIATCRDTIRQQLAGLPPQADEHAARIATLIRQGMNSLLDMATENIGQAYIAEKEQLAARSEERYRSMFECSPLPMWTFDLSTHDFLAVNDAAIRHYGYSRDEFLQMTLEQIRPPEDVAALHDELRRPERPTKAEPWRHRKKDGSIINVEIEANDFVIDGRDVRLVLATDVTERDVAQRELRKTEDQLRHAQKMDAIGRLAGGVAHDFNNILTVIGSYASMLEESLGATDPRHEDASEIRRGAERAAAITRQLLTLSRHSRARPTTLDLDDVVAGFLPMLRRLVGEDIQIVAHRAGVPLVLADAGQMEQVLMNLAANARDAMPDGGRLTIETTTVDVDQESAPLRRLRPGRYVMLAVTDTGTGMDAETQSRIFDPFFTTKDVGKGTGLGLAIVHGIVSQAAGVISVYSELGHGTTFRVHLPVADAAVTAPRVTAAVAPRTLPAMVVLIIDDDVEVRTVAARILKDAGCQTIEAATAEEARHVCVSHDGAIDLVLSDVVLADGRGDLLMSQLRDLRPGLTDILMSGYPAGALTRSGGTPADMLSKPFTPSELRAAVARAIGLATENGDPAARPRPAAAASGPRVLVADDDEQLRRVVVRALRRVGCNVVDVDDGRKAIRELEQRPVDVVVSDVHMPETGGLDLLKAIRLIDLDVPVILMSGTPDVASAATAVENGAFRFLTKPVDMDALGKTVLHATRAHALARLRREAFALTGAPTVVADRAGLEVRFDQAIERLWMAFQPIVDARSGAVFGVEALVRSDEPSMSGPQAILDAATQLNRLPLLGRRIRALSANRLLAEGVALFVNLHPDDIMDVDLVDELAPLTRIASRVVLEVTERASLATSPLLSERIGRLRKLGFRLAVDDIGAGYSGLTSFTELMPEVVKIDMSLVRDVHLSALKQRTIGALCRLCHEVGCLVVGEGVETIDERDCLVGLGCDLLQGYLIGRPGRDLPS